MLETLVGFSVLVGWSLIVYLFGCLADWQNPFKLEVLKDWKIFANGGIVLVVLGWFIFVMYSIGDFLL